MKGRPEDYSQKFSERDGFRDWFANVFWYHYKWPVLVGVAVLAVVIFLAVDSFNAVTYDAHVVVASIEPIGASAFNEIQQVLNEAVGDVDGNGTAEVEIVILSLGDDELGMSNRERIFMLMTDSQYCLYIFDDETGAPYWVPELEYFEALEDYGIESGPNNRFSLSINDNELFERANVRNMSLSIIDHSSVSGKKEDIKTLESALRMVEAILQYQ